MNTPSSNLADADLLVTFPETPLCGFRSSALRRQFVGEDKTKNVRLRSNMSIPQTGIAHRN